MSDQRPAGASSQCPHTEIDLDLNNAGFGDTNLHYLEITGRCKLCDKALRFRGRMGMGPNEPGISIDGSEIRIPFLVEGEELTGDPIGFSVKIGA